MPLTPPDFIVPDEALAEHAAIVGRTGSGKTYTAKGFVERLLTQGRHVVIVDPTGVWWGLRSSKDGKKAGFAVAVFGGDHADVPMTDKAGHQLADIIVQQRVSCVLDVSDFSVAGRTRFLTDFLETLYARNREPLNLVLDEADVMAPQKPMLDQTTLLNRAEQIVRRGRARGLRVILITQRPAVLNKNVLTQVGTLLALKLTAPQDRDALGAWIEGQADRDEGKAVLASLPKLKVGEGWVWWPEGEVLVRTRFPNITTFDSSSTPLDGAARVAPVLASVDIAALQALLAPPAVRTTPPAADGDAQAGAIREALARGREQGREQLRGTIEALESRLQLLEGVIRQVADLLPAPIATASEPQAPFRKKAGLPPPPKNAHLPRNGEDHAPGASNYFGKAERRVLAVLAIRHPAQVTEAQWATLAGMKRTGGAWLAYKGKLRMTGMVEQNGRLWHCTQTGLTEAGHQPAAPQTSAQLLAVWRHAIGTGAGRMLDTLARCPRDGLSRQALAAELRMAERGGAFNAYLSKLRANDLVAEHNGRLKLAEILQ